MTSSWENIIIITADKVRMDTKCSRKSISFDSSEALLGLAIFFSGKY
jgi:hypothetical protein